MFPVTLHPLGRYDPNASRKIDLIPGGKPCFGSAGGGQDQEFKCARGYAVVYPQLAHKDADFDVGQGGMMDDAPNLLGRRQPVLQITPQPGWVLAIPIAMGRSP